jgi:hypothetical protein
MGNEGRPPAQEAEALFLRARSDLATNPLVSGCSSSKGLRRLNTRHNYQLIAADDAGA